MSRNINRQARGLLSLVGDAVHLKAITRTGWLDRGIPRRQVESVADHSHAVALVAWACAVERRNQGADLDPARVALLALIHDLPEADTGDAPPYHAWELPPAAEATARHAFLDRRHIRDDAAASAKRANEDAAMRELVNALPTAIGSEMQSLWLELRAGATAEAQFVKQVDRLETFLQSRIYQEQYPDAPMDSFRREVLDTIGDPLLAAIRDEALSDDSWISRSPESIT